MTTSISDILLVTQRGEVLKGFFPSDICISYVYQDLWVFRSLENQKQLTTTGLLNGVQVTGVELYK